MHNKGKSCRYINIHMFINNLNIQLMSSDEPYSCKVATPPKKVNFYTDEVLVLLFIYNRSTAHGHL